MSLASSGYARSLAALVHAALSACLVTACGGRAESDAAVMSTQRNNPGTLPAITVVQGSIIDDDGVQGTADVEDVQVRSPGLPLRIESSEGSGVPSVYVERSSLGTTLELVEANQRICVRGQLAPVPNGDYPNYWGGEVGLALVSNPREQVDLNEGMSTRGFAFRLEGVLPPLIRFRAGASGEVPLLSQYCVHVPLKTGTRIEVTLDELTVECWNGAGTSFPDAARAALVSWQIPANETTVETFDFCIDGIESLERG